MNRHNVVLDALVGAAQIRISLNVDDDGRNIEPFRCKSAEIAVSPACNVADSYPTRAALCRILRYLRIPAPPFDAWTRVSDDPTSELVWTWSLGAVNPWDLLLPEVQHSDAAALGRKAAAAALPGEVVGHLRRPPESAVADYRRSFILGSKERVITSARWAYVRGFFAGSRPLQVDNDGRIERLLAPDPDRPFLDLPAPAPETVFGRVTSPSPDTWLRHIVSTGLANAERCEIIPRSRCSSPDEWREAPAPWFDVLDALNPDRRAARGTVATVRHNLLRVAAVGHPDVSRSDLVSAYYRFSPSHGQIRGLFRALVFGPDEVPRSAIGL